MSRLRIVVAGPTVPDLMRETLSAPTRACLSHEVREDLVHSPLEAFRAQLPARRTELSGGPPRANL